jgi:sulfur relay (sulfurtransferase) DsrF/TusC family protein
MRSSQRDCEDDKFTVIVHTQYNTRILFISSPLYNVLRVMSAGLQELKTVFKGLQTLYQTYLPRVDPILIHDLLVREREKSEHSPFYMVEIFTKPGTDSEEMKNKIFEKTGGLPTIYDSGTHYVTNQRLTLEALKEISDSEDVIEVTGDYTGSIGGWGASHEHKDHEYRQGSNTSPSSSTSQQQIQEHHTSYQRSTDRLREIKTVFKGLQTLYQTYLPKADPILIHDLLVREREKSEHSPFYMVEIFTKPGTDSEEMKNKIFEKTGGLPTIYDSGTHYVTNQRLTLEALKEISDSEDVIEVTGDYTGSIGGWGASHEAKTRPSQ